MKVKKIVSLSMATVLMVGIMSNIFLPEMVHARELVDEIVGEMPRPEHITKEGVIDFSSIKVNSDLSHAEFDNSDLSHAEFNNSNLSHAVFDNAITHRYERVSHESYSADLISALDDEDTEYINNNPDNAYLITLGDSINDSVTTELDQRWYAFSVDKTTKFTAAMVMDDTVDYDLYLFKLNEEENTLNLVGGSAVASNGLTEFAIAKLDRGTYFIGIEAASGTGGFSIYTYAGVNDSKEINDSIDSASSYIRNSRMTATIDSPFDYDYYKLVIGTNDILEYTFDAPSGYDYKVLLYDGTSYYNISNGTYRLNSGTYYFIVCSNSIDYSDNQYYGIKFQKYKLANDEDATFMWYTPDMSAIFQFNSTRTNFYVNGNPINFTYSKTIQSNGSIYFDLYKTANQNVVLLQSESMQTMMEVPFFINYQAPFSGWSSYSNALVIGVYNTNWRVNSFSSNYNGLTSSYATLIIDSNSGKVVDVMTPNPLYDNGVVLHWTRVYGVKSNYNYDPVD